MNDPQVLNDTDAQTIALAKARTRAGGAKAPRIRREALAWLAAVSVNGALLCALVHVSNAPPMAEDHAIVLDLVPPQPAQPNSRPSTDRQPPSPRAPRRLADRFSPPPLSIPPTPVAPASPQPPANAAVRPAPGLALRPRDPCLKPEALRTREENEICYARLATGPSTTSERSVPLNLAKQAVFDAEAKAQREQRYRPMLKPFEPCKGVGSNFGTGCQSNHQ